MAAPVDAGAAYTHPAGSAFAYNTDGTTWLTVGGVQEVQAPGIELNKSDSTPLSSLTETSTPGMRKEGEWEVTLFMAGTLLATLIGLITAKTYINMRLQWPLITGQATANQMVWTGYILSFMPNKQQRNNDDKIAVTFKGNAANGTAAFTVFT